MWTKYQIQRVNSQWITTVFVIKNVYNNWYQFSLYEPRATYSNFALSQTITNLTLSALILKWIKFNWPVIKIKDKNIIYVSTCVFFYGILIFIHSVSTQNMMSYKYIDHQIAGKLKYL